jgi:hypothetical protein
VGRAEGRLRGAGAEEGGGEAVAGERRAAQGPAHPPAAGQVGGAVASALFLQIMSSTLAAAQAAGGGWRAGVGGGVGARGLRPRPARQRLLGGGAAAHRARGGARARALCRPLTGDAHRGGEDNRGARHLGGGLSGGGAGRGGAGRGGAGRGGARTVGRVQSRQPVMRATRGPEAAGPPTSWRPLPWPVRQWAHLPRRHKQEQRPRKRGGGRRRPHCARMVGTCVDGGGLRRHCTARGCHGGRVTNRGGRPGGAGKGGRMSGRGTDPPAPRRRHGRPPPVAPAEAIAQRSVPSLGAPQGAGAHRGEGLV